MPFPRTSNKNTKCLITSCSSFSGFYHNVSLTDGLAERISRNDRVKSGVRFADPVEDYAMPDGVKLTHLDPPFGHVLVRKSVVVLRVQSGLHWFVVFVPDEVGYRPATDLNLSNNIKLLVLMIKSLRIVDVWSTSVRRRS